MRSPFEISFGPSRRIDFEFSLPSASQQILPQTKTSSCTKRFNIQIYDLSNISVHVQLYLLFIICLLTWCKLMFKTIEKQEERSILTAQF